jgi:hypothetical protein
LHKKQVASALDQTLEFLVLPHDLLQHAEKDVTGRRRMLQEEEGCYRKKKDVTGRSKMLQVLCPDDSLTGLAGTFHCELALGSEDVVNL